MLNYQRVSSKSHGRNCGVSRIFMQLKPPLWKTKILWTSLWSPNELGVSVTITRPSKMDGRSISYHVNTIEETLKYVVGFLGTPYVLTRLTLEADPEGSSFFLTGEFAAEGCSWSQDGLGKVQPDAAGPKWRQRGHRGPPELPRVERADVSDCSWENSSKEPTGFSLFNYAMVMRERRSAWGIHIPYIFLLDGEPRS